MQCATELRRVQQASLLARAISNSYIPHTPTLRQAEFLMLPDREAMYGGAAGGGKSDALLMAALQFVDIPHYNALLLRRTYKDLALPGALMERAASWLASSGAHWNNTDKAWTFPSGARIIFGYLESENDKYRYQGAEFQFVGFDELTQFTLTQYTYLFSRLRRLVGSECPLRMRGASNPGGVGHAWVKQRFIVEGAKFGRPFVRSGISDNPHINREEYSENLKELDPVTRAQLLEGDWNVKEVGSKFKRAWFADKIVRALPPDIVAGVRFWDMAATEAKPGTDPDYTAGCRMSVTRQGVYIIHDITRARVTPQASERLIRSLAMRDGKSVKVFMEQEPGASGVITIDHYRRTVLPDFAFYGFRKSGSKELMANPLSSQSEAGNVLLLEGPYINTFLEEAETFPGGEHDDQVDAASGAYAQLAREVLRLGRSGNSYQA